MGVVKRQVEQVGWIICVGIITVASFSSFISYQRLTYQAEVESRPPTLASLPFPFIICSLLNSHINRCFTLNRLMRELVETDDARVPIGSNDVDASGKCGFNSRGNRSCGSIIGTLPRKI